MQIPMQLLTSRLDDLLAIPDLPEHVRNHLMARLSLLETPPQELWELLEGQAQISDEHESDDEMPILRLTEGLARHPEFAAPKAMAVVQDDQQWDALAVCCIDLLGEIRHQPAADLLVHKMTLARAGDYKFDAVSEAALNGLAMLDGLEVIPKLVAAYQKVPPTDAWGFVEVIRKFKIPEAELALVDLLLKENDTEIKTFLAYSLIGLCTTLPQAWEALAWMVETDEFDDSFTDLKRDMLVFCEMVDYKPPALAQWAAQVQAQPPGPSTAHLVNMLREEHERWIQTGSRFQEVDDEEDEDDADWQADDDEDQRDEKEDEDDPYIQPVTTYRRPAPKVGRNEPCPCGSGKKYKKCCGQ